jgi:hypothetical protein
MAEDRSKTLRDKVRSSVIREGCKIKPLNKGINNTRTKWNEHIDRMESNRPVRKVRDWIPNRRNNLGRPKVQLKDTARQENLMDATSYKA